MARTAQVQRDAKIGEAEARKDSGIKVQCYSLFQGFVYICMSVYDVVDFVINHSSVLLLVIYSLLLCSFCMFGCCSVFF